MPCVNGWTMRQKGVSVSTAVLRGRATPQYVYNHNAEYAGEEVSFHARNGRLSLENGKRIGESGSADYMDDTKYSRIPRK